MDIIRHPRQMQELALKWRGCGQSIGLVPTMGYLHEGHLSLAQRARRENDLVVMSIFVNPLQFGPQEDFARYPRDLERDCRLAGSAGVDVIFAPSGEEMYPSGYCTSVEVCGELTNKMCGLSRPGHFRGVTTVVLKLLHIVQPHRAYFGQKDAQQAAVIRRMVEDLNLPLEIVTCPIIREADGLAMSSRNVYLSPEERQQALALPRALAAGREMILQGERDPERVRGRIEELLSASPGVRVDYVEVCAARDLTPLTALAGEVLLAAAVFVGQTRLIDNIVVEVSKCNAP